MLLCNNTANPCVCGIISPMSDADALAQRYLALWTEYLTALLADPQAMETLDRWSSFAEQFDRPAPGAAKQGLGAAPFLAWPPLFGPFGLWPVPPGPGNDPAGLSALAQRVDALERRLAKLERRPASRRPRRGAGTKGC
jgi:hypothetical protein